LKSVLGATSGDQAVRSLGIVRLAFPLPIAASGGEVNVYLIDNADGSLTMFDTGLGTESAAQALQASLAAVGRRLEDVQRIIISHGHPDHFGGARRIRDLTKAPVFVHPRDAAKILVAGVDLQGGAALGRYLQQLGAPADILVRIGERYKNIERAAPRLEDATSLEDGAQLEFRAFGATVVNTPGHTPGHIVLHAPGPRIVLGADHLLGRISPCPLIELGPGEGEKSHRALVRYFDSLRLLEDMDLDWVLPGHGEPFTDHRRVIASLRGFYQKRQGRLLGQIQVAPRTPYELAITEFGSGRDDELFLIMSEIIGNLEMLEDQGAVQAVAGSTPQRYCVAR
jgi:glyoxylase-like metal-dependent hydrolase (beta-lactamase superfamily II)